MYLGDLHRVFQKVNLVSDLHQIMKTIMGRSEWAILLTTSADVDKLLEVSTRHNSSTRAGEPVVINCVLRFDGKLYACIMNSGGREQTTRFLRKSYPKGKHPEVLYPFAKPDGWHECKEIVWQKCQGMQELYLLFNQ